MGVARPLPISQGNGSPHAYAVLVGENRGSLPQYSLAEKMGLTWLQRPIAADRERCQTVHQSMCASSRSFRKNDTVSEACEWRGCP